MSLPIDPDKHLFLLATSTEEKIERYQAAADAMGLPFVFVNLKKLSLFHSALEDTGTMEGNVHQKLGEIDAVYAQCRDKNSPLHAAMAELARHYGVDPEKAGNIHFAADDATFTVPREIWDKPGYLWEKLMRVVDLDVVASGDGKDRCGPGAEVGPIMAATGVRNLFNMIRTSALEAAKELGTFREDLPVIVTNLTTLSMRSLNDPATRDFTAELDLPLLTNKKLSEPFTTEPVAFDKTESWFVNSSSFTSDPHDRDLKTPVKRNLEYISEGRYDIVKQLAKSLGLKPFTKRPIPPRRHPALPAANTFAQELETLNEAKLAGNKVAVLDFTGHGKNGDGNGKSTYDMLTPVERTIRESEGFILKPISTSPDVSDRLMAQLYLQSLIVARQLEPRDIDKPIVIMNLKRADGKGTPMNGWEDTIEAIIDQTRKGMFKEYDPRLYGARPLKMNGVKHQMISDFEVVSSADEKKLNAAAQAIMDSRMKHRIRTAPPKPLPGKIEGAAPPEDMYKVAVWTSATNDNKRLIEDLRHVGAYLAENDNGLVWGAGDRHGMGAIFDGYDGARKGHRTWVGAYSTPAILISESKYGDFPKDKAKAHLTDYRELNTNIYERMAHMIEHSNAIVVAPGGAGTNQEWLTALMVKRQSPEKMRNKPIILFAPDLIEESKAAEPGHSEHKLFWERPASAFLGADTWEALKQDHRAKAGDGIFLATDKDELESLIGELKLQQRYGGMLASKDWSTAVAAERAQPPSPFRILQ